MNNQHGQLIRSAWDQYAEYWLTPNHSPRQAAEMKRAFYAGVTAMTKIVDVYLSQSGKEPEELNDADVEVALRSIEMELEDFITLMKLGVA